MEERKIPYKTLKTEFEKILLKYGFSSVKAKQCAGIFAVNSLDGIYSHGVNRFPRFIEFIRKGYVKPGAEPKKVHESGALEQWDGNLGPGPLNALACTSRAMELASKNGIGCVALANTNHWMRAGYYGWEAARKGYALIAWTNTEANMPAWGAAKSRMGNNPMVFAMPYENEAVVLDFAMTQFSYGKMETSRMEMEDLPVPGGFDTNGKLTNNPDEILDSRLALPIGYWKGAGLSLLLDIFAAILSGGRSVAEISRSEAEYGVSQVFIAIDLKKLNNYPAIQQSLKQILTDYTQSETFPGKEKIRYPGENATRLRKENLKKGIPIHPKVWEEICNL